MRALGCLGVLLLAGCQCVNPDALGRTACQRDDDCPNADERCCGGYCRPSCAVDDPDAGDAGRLDAGPPHDSGVPDAGAPDSGTFDAGTPPDAGAPDAGEHDAGVLLGAGEPCTANAECASTACAQSVCCDQPCNRSCERCDLPGHAGTCTTADAGAALCPMALTCDGTSPDCPIPCGSCPADSYCLPGFDRCRAKLAQAEACTDTVECLSGHCVDGVCCNTACGGGVADCQACSIATGAPADGACAYLPGSVVCRPAVGPCDVAEMCNGVSAMCPADQKAPPMTMCGASQLGACMFDGGLACAGDQVETQLRCAGSGACNPVMVLQQATAACAALREGVQCANASYSACRYAQTCSTGGDRDRTDSACSGGMCLPHNPVTQMNDPACGRPTDGGTCGTGQRCASGQCACDTTACAAVYSGGGCCEGDVCSAGNTTAACGTGGAACATCPGGECCGPGAADATNACRLVCL